MKRITFISLVLVNLCSYGAPLTIGVLNYAPPFSATTGDGKQFYGFTIDLMDTLCKRTANTCTYRGLSLGTQIEALNQGIIDLAFAPNPISKDNPNNLIFSLPYLNSNVQFVTNNDNGLNSTAQIYNKKIGVLKDTLLNLLLNSEFSLTNTVVQYSKTADLIAAVTAKQVDVIIVNETIAKYYVNNSFAELKLVGNKIRLGDGYGILALQKEEHLISEINNALLAMERDGTYLKIYNKYFGN